MYGTVGSFLPVQHLLYILYVLRSCSPRRRVPCAAVRTS